jgi:hypothetical protein
MSSYGIELDPQVCTCWLETEVPLLVHRVFSNPEVRARTSDEIIGVERDVVSFKPYPVVSDAIESSFML